MVTWRTYLHILTLPTLRNTRIQIQTSTIRQRIPELRIIGTNAYRDVITVLQKLKATYRADMTRLLRIPSSTRITVRRTYGYVTIRMLCNFSTQGYLSYCISELYLFHTTIK